MTSKVAPAIPRGTRDFLPEKMMVRQHVIGVIREVFESFGFEPLETPAIELAETLEGKYGEEGEHLMYRLRDRGGQQLGLRYDLTVPMSRVVAMYRHLPRPFKRYQMQPVWRADRPQRGRYREFWQCDADTVGSTSMLADAEILNMMYLVLTRLGFQEFSMRINNRKLLSGIVEAMDVPTELAPDVFRAMDRLDRVGLDGVREHLLYRNEQGERVAFLSEDKADRVIDLMRIQGSSASVLDALGNDLKTSPIALEGVQEIREVTQYLEMSGVSEGYVRVDPSLARGLAYYTGPIFETVIAQRVKEGAIGSVTGGGRYDELVGMFASQSIPATGTSLGMERIIDVMEQLQSSEGAARRTVTKVLVTVFDANLISEALGQNREIREAGINTEIFLDARDLGAQLRYADRKGIPLAIITGPDELAKNTVLLRDMTSSEQVTVRRDKLAKAVLQRLDSA